MFDVLRGVDAPPEFLAEALKLEDRERLRGFKRLAEEVRHLLGDRAPITLRTRLQSSVQGVWKILDVQCGQGVPPLFLHSGSLEVIGQPVPNGG